MKSEERTWDVIVVGGGQAGLSVGYHLKDSGLSHCIIDASARVGDVWRKRWDSLRLFTPARYDALDGLPFPAPSGEFPTKDEMADYLEHYAAHFELPVLSGVVVEEITRDEGAFLIVAGERRFRARSVVVAMGSYQKPHIPGISHDLAAGVRQLHSLDYKNPKQLRPGNVLLVGAGNTGSELAMELSKTHRVVLSGRHTGQLPFRIGSIWGRLFLVRLVLRLVFHRILSLGTPIGRRVRPKVIVGGGPLIRVRARDLKQRQVTRVPRVTGFQDSHARFEDGQELEVDNVIWCTGFKKGLSFLKFPIFDELGHPRHEAGICHEVPGLYFVGQHFLYSLSSGMIHGVGRDAARIAAHLVYKRTSQKGLRRAYWDLR